MLKDKIALVTGGSSGIGEAISRKFAELGAHVAVVASSDISKAARVAEEINASGGRASPFAADVRNATEVTTLAGEVTEKLGGIDILVNAAGVYYPTPVIDGDINGVKDMIDINMLGVWNCITAVAPEMKERGNGNIINFSSVAGYVGLGTFSMYCATKAAIIMLTRSLACELAAYNINVNAIAPGNTATPMNQAVRDDEQIMSAMSNITPSNTTFSNPEDIASAAVYLVSDGAKPMHGSTMLMDEGLSAGVSL